MTINLYDTTNNTSIVVADVVRFPVNSELFHGYNIGEPAKGILVVDSTLIIAGWVVGKSPVVAVEVVSDEKVIQEIPTGVYRHDLVKLYGNLAAEQKTNFGFRQKVNLSGIAEKNELLLRAVFSDARRVPIVSIKLGICNREDLISSNIGPDFMIIGAMKAATSAIYDYLQLHPRVIRRQPKELHFFSYHFEKGLSWYLSNFTAKREAPSNQNLLIGEASPSYLIVKEVPSLVKEAFPDVKIIVSLRNPTERAISQYYHQVKRVGDEKRSIEEAFSEGEIEKSMEILPTLENDKQKLDIHIRKSGYTAFYLLLGQYVSQLRNWLKFFPREQILILNYHDLESQPQYFVKKLFTFLDLQDRLPSKVDKIYESKYPPAATSVKQRLNEYYSSYNEELEKFLNMKFSWS